MKRPLFWLVLIASFCIVLVCHADSGVNVFMAITPTPSPTVAPTPSPTPAPAPGGVVLPGFLGGATPSPSPASSAIPTGLPVPSPTGPGNPLPTSPGTATQTGIPGSSPGPESSPESSEPASEIPEIATGIVSGVSSVASVARSLAVAVSAIALIAIAGAAVTLSQAGISLANIFGFATQSSWEVVGIKKKAKIWGTIYDSRTKRGIPYAKVELLDPTNRVLEVRYADHDGRYGFLASPKGLSNATLVVRIRPTVHAYTFPASGLTSGITDYIVYDHIYTGGDVTVTKDQIVNANVPMDPVAGSQKHTEYPSFISTGRFISGGLNAMFWIGIVAAPVAYWMQPTLTNLVILVVFVLLNAFRMLTSLYRPFGVVRDARTGKPLPYALIELDEMSGKRVTFSVSDEFGRYFLIVAAGTYMLQLHTPANVQPQRTKSELVTTRRGWISRKVAL
ncbi:MAG TPA: carboxypeptidase-like regulatory domain-containing protein [Candidatus Paceibacterota bacterium]|nr:carboxypeptidase-like regulatory domain-containing protein [Candidatus Paceibacterota bacterium]